MSWLSYQYNIFGELYWGTNAADRIYPDPGNSSWEQQWLAGESGQLCCSMTDYCHTGLLLTMIWYTVPNVVPCMRMQSRGANSFVPILFVPILFVPILFVPILFVPILFVPTLLCQILFYQFFCANSGAGGNGDGSLTYPGRTDEIGGSHFIPVASLRLKQIRDGLEDLEYMYLLEDKLGSRDAVLDTVGEVAQKAYSFQHDAAIMRNAREVG